ncbi:mechanosensitive ion channel family protein [Halorubellus salinus]|uniref:mechanosensitive ion channel family protein n=1 Tax=Halorubellus salinus TaxID=755309 RepID=UPI001D05D55B
MVAPARGLATSVLGAVAQTTPSSDPNVFEAINWNLLLEAVPILVFAYLLAKLTSTLLSGVADRFVAARFRVTVLIPVFKLAIYGTAVYFAFSLLFDLTENQLLALSGVMGAAVGFGLKDLLADLVGGLVLVAEQPYQIGDKVAIGEYYGEVVDIGLRSTSLVTPNDNLVTVPNYLFFNESIANGNAGAAEMLVTVEFYVDPESDAARARELVEEAMLTSQYVYVTDDLPHEVLLDDDVHYRKITGKAYVNDLRNEFPFRTDVTKRALAAFDREGIESPKVPSGVAGEIDHPGVD